MANGMEQSMMPQEQQMQQQGQPQQLNQDQLFPANDKEADAMEDAAFQMMYDQKMGVQMVKTIEQSNTIEEGVAQMTAVVVMKVMTAFTQQTGRDIDPEYLDEFVDIISKEFFRMLFVAEIIKEQPPKQTMMQIGDIAMSMIEEMIMGQMQQQEQGQEGQQMPSEQEMMAQQGGSPQQQQNPSLMG
jgi:hypothetical protein